MTARVERAIFAISPSVDQECINVFISLKDVYAVRQFEA